MSEDSASAVVSVRAVSVDGVPVLRVAGEVDMRTVDRLRPELLAWLDGAPERVAIDLTGVTFLASSGLALLIEAAARADQHGVRIVLVADHRAVLRPIQATNLDQVFDVHPDVDHAVADARPAPPSTEVEAQDA
ncbi:STAS domain-containing protein [Saccharothrix sp. S26]|uniref:STAS domain-containing protein n=1 Tax=Saccharothrix sp. S26 TaxID=2907215 RepID=UPI001F1CB8A5|nr:STAS domain-containing protein [Saccharothrix sp. S26]MCE6997321.1 STAS domain-containing protein [Saccharothrix sp. S26]